MTVLNRLGAIWFMDMGVWYGGGVVCWWWGKVVKNVLKCDFK